MRVINENLALLNRTRDVEKKLSYSQDAIRELRELAPFFEKGLVSLKPTPQESVARLYVAERKIVQGYIEELLDDMGGAGDGTVERRSKVEHLNVVLDAIEKYSVYLGEANTMLLRKRVEKQLSIFLMESAEKDTSAGHRERALDRYIEALDMIRSDLKDDPDQQKRVESIKTRIRDLGGKVPKRWDEAEPLDRMTD